VRQLLHLHADVGRAASNGSDSARRTPCGPGDRASGVARSDAPWRHRAATGGARDGRPGGPFSLYPKAT